MNALRETMGAEINFVFDAMEVAEDEIKKAKRKFPRKAKRIDRCFAILRPTDPLRGKSFDLYRAHCQALIGRALSIVASSNDRSKVFGDATDAEIIGYLSETSMKAPLNSTGQGLYEWLFSQTFPNHLLVAEECQLPPGPYLEMYKELRHRAREDWRVEAWRESIRNEEARKAAATVNKRVGKAAAK